MLLLLKPLWFNIFLLFMICKAFFECLLNVLNNLNEDPSRILFLHLLLLYLIPNINWESSLGELAIIFLDSEVREINFGIDMICLACVQKIGKFYNKLKQGPIVQLDLLSFRILIESLITFSCHFCAYGKIVPYMWKVLAITLNNRC